MLIESIGLKNFKCFEEVNVDFAPITLLTGANSSGKSSLINAILGVLQSRYFPEYYSLNGYLVNMGSFDEIVWHGKKTINEFEISIMTSRSMMLGFEKTIQTLWKKNEITEQPELKKLTIDNEESQITSMFSEAIQLSNKMVSLQDFINHTNYIGSYRLPPERTYYRKPNASKIGVSGEGYIDQIIDWEENNALKFNQLLSALKEIGLFYEIKSNKIKGGRFEINVKVNEKSPLASLTDVGFGISQFLPIIVADLQLDDNSCLITSQPEIHLHPKIQASLANYFCKQIHQTKKQYIVETHSEYLLNRVRLLLVKGELKPEDVKLYYMENDGYKTTTYDIELTTDGQIKNAPKGFFETYEMDVMDIALAATEL